MAKAWCKGNFSCSVSTSEEVYFHINKSPNTVEPQFNGVPRDWENGSLNRGFVMFFAYFTVTFSGLKNIICYTEDFVI